MGKYYSSHEEKDAYKEGYRDNEQGRRNYYHDKYSDKGVDRAYWNGREDQEREARERQEQQEAEDAEIRRHEQHRRDEEEYNTYLQMQIEDQIEAEHAYAEAMANQNSHVHPDYYAPEYDVEPPVETPITEEELFMRIQEDERIESLPNNDTNE